MFNTKKIVISIFSLLLLAIGCTQSFAGILSDYMARERQASIMSRYSLETRAEIEKETNRPSFATIMNNTKPEWVTYAKPKDANPRSKHGSRYEVCVNTKNIICYGPYKRKLGIVFCLRDILMTQRSFAHACGETDQMAHGTKIDPPRVMGTKTPREMRMWYGYMTTPCVITYNIVVYKDDNRGYLTWCYDSRQYQENGRVTFIREDYLGNASWEDRYYYLPLFEQAVEKWLEVNGYKDLDELFSVKLGQ